MCYCCCPTRKGIIIYMMVVSIFAFIYGIVAISYFGSSTDIYKYFKEKLDALKKSGSSSSSGSSYSGSTSTGYSGSYSYNYNYPIGYNKETEKWAKAVLDTISKGYIDDLNSTSGYSTSVIGNLKSIENGLGVVLFIFPIIFLVVEIVFLVFTCGDKEFTPLPETTFKVLNAIKIICLTLSVIFIFLAILYGILLVVAYVEYITIVQNLDSCGIGILVGMIYGYYGFWFYITISVGFSKERDLFKQVGSIENPGPGAKFDANGNPIAPVVQAVIQPLQSTIQPVQPITYANVKQINTGVIPIDQSQRSYQPLSLNSKDEEFIFYNGVIYKKFSNAKNITSAELSNIPNTTNNDRPNQAEIVQIKPKQNEPPTNDEKGNK